MTPRQQRLVRERLLSPIFDGGDWGELANERARANRYEEILEKVADVLNCKSDFGMILPNLLALKNKVQEFTWDESIRTGSWRGLCSKCGKRQCYYHEPTNRLFPLCAVCGVDAINELLGEKIL